jgi:hypothetical protein
LKNICTHQQLVGNVVERRSTTLETQQVLTSSVGTTAITSVIDGVSRCLFKLTTKVHNINQVLTGPLSGHSVSLKYTFIDRLKIPPQKLSPDGLDYS